MPTFDTLRITPETLNAIAAMGFEEPTPVQTRAIPPMLDGKDILVQARTGTGKTAAFAIPIVEDARANPGTGILALVVAPTRELALQVAQQLDALARRSPLKTVVVYGGVGYGNQEAALRRPGPLAVVATPGRLLDLMQRGTLRLDQVRLLVLDEADRMLDMGFLPDVERILAKLPKERQTALFSATLPEAVRRVSQRFMRQPEFIRIEQGAPTAPLADQFRVDVGRESKAAALMSLLRREQPERAVVFTRTKHLAKRLAQRLERDGWAAVSLQGNMGQSARNRALDVFRQGRARILVATDVASRGLDVPEISHVINFDMPSEPDVYVHRIGRTARMGRPGRAFTFVQPDEQRDLHQLERTAGSTLAEYALEDVPPPSMTAAPAPDAHSGNGGRSNGGRPYGNRGRSNARRGPNRGRPYGNGDRSNEDGGRSNGGRYPASPRSGTPRPRRRPAW